MALVDTEVPLPHRDFAYVARDKLTQMLKCHVFRCEAPAKNIATSLHEICSKARPPPLPGLAATFSTRVWVGSLSRGGGIQAEEALTDPLSLLPPGPPFLRSWLNGAMPVAW